MEKIINNNRCINIHFINYNSEIKYLNQFKFGSIYFLTNLLLNSIIVYDSTLFFGFVVLVEPPTPGLILIYSIGWFNQILTAMLIGGRNIGFDKF